MEKYLYIPTPNKHAGRRRKLRFIVWHSTESNEIRGGAYNIAANWFAKPTSRVSAHVTIDDGSDPRYPSGVVESVYPWDTAWHCGNANADGYGVEIIGKAGQSGIDWRDAYSLAAIENAVKWLQWNDKVNHIPARWLSDDQVKDGKTQGHVTHAQVARVLGGSSHWDPGPNFPRDYVMGLFGVEVPRPTPVPPVVTDRPLTYGMMNDPGVKKAQEFFRTRYSYAKNLPATGNYLGLTVQVVKRFQANMGITGPDADGRRIGPRTYTGMRQEGWK